MIINADMKDALPLIPANSVDSCVTDPPYHLASIVARFGKADSAPAKVGATGAYARASTGFMGQEWDGGDVAFDPDTWRAVYRVMKPGAHLVAFSGSRTYHRMACAIEDAGFEIRDQLMWLYGSGFPKSHDISKAIDKMAGAEREMVRTEAANIRNPKSVAGGHGVDGGDRPWMREAIEKGYHEKPGKTPVTLAAQQWQGWGTALKPAHEPIVLARKPISEKNIAANVLRWGTGGLAIDACRVGDDERVNTAAGNKAGGAAYNMSVTGMPEDVASRHVTGRHPANVLHTDGLTDPAYSKFFYHAKANHSDRVKRCNQCGFRTYERGVVCPTCLDRMLISSHPTVKPLALMDYLCRLVTPPQGVIFDPFAGTGSTMVAARDGGFDGIGVEMSREYFDDIKWRLKQ